MKMRNIVTLSLLTILSVSVLLAATPSGLTPDEVIVRYPQGYTKLMIADLAKILNDPVLQAAFLEPLGAARHPLSGINQIVQDTLRLDPNMVQFVAHGEGPGLTSFSLLQGLPQEATFGALMGIKFAAAAPGSPFKNWDIVESGGLPVVRTGGTFGPVNIQWAYVPTADALWVGTETSFGQPANVDQLSTTTDDITARIQGRSAYFDELLIALGTRGGDVAFVRQTDLSVDQPVTQGEQAFGFAMSFTPEGAQVTFDVRFINTAAASEALDNLQDGTSAYLAQGLYQGTLIGAQQSGNELLFVVNTDLKGAVGLILAVMPN